MVDMEFVNALREHPVPVTGRRWRRRAVFAAATAAALVVSSVAALTYPWHSVGGSPERLLQAVNVDLGSDGHVVGITATNVHRTAKGSTHETARLDTSGVESQLPVRVDVGYVMDGKAGHNLADVVGKSGTIEVDVTVTNVTQHWELVSYSDAQGTHEANAQVAAPVTVVGTATLPKNSFDTFQTPTASASPLEDNTGGVVQTTADGDTAVQWASVLAPPRLSASATFRLVESTTSFKVPRFSIAAQPGVVAGPSTGQLLGAAFAGGTGTDAGQLLNLERDAVAKIGSLQRQLADAAGQLTGVENSFSGPAGRPSREATTKLSATAVSLRQNSALLASTLKQLDASWTATLDAPDSGARQQLDGALEVIANYLGVGSVKDATSPQLPQDCHAGDLNKVAPPKTLLGQLSMVAGETRSLAVATSSCAGAISASLGSVIGPASAKDCAPTSQALTCGIAATSTALGTLTDDVTAAQGQILAHLDPSYQATVATDVGKLVQAVGVAQGQAAAIVPSSGAGSTKKLLAAVGSVQAQVRTAMNLLSAGQAGQAGLNHDVQTVHQAALADLATLAPAGGSSSIADQIAELDNRICNPPSDMSSGLDRDYVAVLNALVSGGSCGGTVTSGATDSLFSTPLSVRVATLRANLSGVLAQTGSGGSGIAADFAPLERRLSGIDSSLGAISADLRKHEVPPSTLADNLATVVSDLDSLYDAKAGAAAAACSSAPAGSPPLNILTKDFQALTCKAGGVADVKALLGTLKVQAGKNSSRVTTGAAGAGAGAGAGTGSRQATVTTLGALLAGLSRDLQESTVRPRTLDAGLRQGVAALNRSIGGADDASAASAQHLQALAASVLAYLAGSSDGAAGWAATTGPGGVALARAQLREGMREAQSLPALGVQQATGSRHLAVYVFTLGVSQK